MKNELVNYPDYMFEEAEKREKENLIDDALSELDAILLGGQDTREFFNSVRTIRKALESLK